MFKISKEELYDLYINKNLSSKDIGDIYGVSASLVCLRLKENNIKKEKKDIYKSVENTMMKKYGVSNIFKDEDFKKENKKKCLEKYGVDNISKAKEVKEKKRKKSLEKYGVDFPLKSEKIKEKIRQTNLKKYGTENPMQNKKIQQKLKKTMKNKYGVEFALQRPETLKKIKEEMYKRYGVNNALSSEKIKVRIKNTCLEKYGVPYFCMAEKCKKANGFTISKINKKVSERLEKEGIGNNFEYNINRYSYDIKLKNRNVLIEINPTYTHNSTKCIEFRNHQKKPLEKEYHQNKTLTAKENGYRCIHIWDWDDTDKIIKMLKEKETIVARKCEIKNVSLEETSDFLNENHLQNTCKGQSIRLGLYYNNELVEIMTFGKPRYNNKYEYELIRLCSKSEYMIIGGAEKIFKHFVKEYKPKTIISYCDNSKFDGEVYKKLGFELLDYGKPSKHWYNGKIHITDNLLRQRGYDQLFKTNYGKGTSNEELMKENGFVEIYDCGQSIYEYKV